MYVYQSAVAEEMKTGAQVKKELPCIFLEDYKLQSHTLETRARCG